MWKDLSDKKIYSSNPSRFLHEIEQKINKMEHFYALCPCKEGKGGREGRKRGQARISLTFRDPAKTFDE
jgi:hypothetical protein